jgi:hypothetical protein
MTQRHVFGQSAAQPRPTLIAALWLACLISIPVGVIGLTVDLVLR